MGLEATVLGFDAVEVEGAGDMTIERLTAQSRGDFLSDVFGRRLGFREAVRA